MMMMMAQDGRRSGIELGGAQAQGGLASQPWLLVTLLVAATKGKFDIR